MTRKLLRRRRVWVMVCDQDGCTTRSEAFPSQPDLDIFAGRGWHVALVYGDVCSACLERGVVPFSIVRRSAENYTSRGITPPDRRDTRQGD